MSDIMARDRILEPITHSGTLFPDQQDVLTPFSVVGNEIGSVHVLFCTTGEGPNGVEMSC